MAADAFQKLKSSVNRGITTINVKTSSAFEKTKVKTHIESLNREIEKDLIAVGSDAYKIWANDGSDLSPLFSQFEKIKAEYCEVETLTAQLSAIDERDNQILGNTQEKPKDEPPTYICSNCGAQYENPVNFCRKCGNKMGE